MPAYLQVTPTELMLTPGQTVKLRARLFDDKGRSSARRRRQWTSRGSKEQSTTAR